MTQSTQPLPIANVSVHRSPIYGLIQIVRFNWPQYAAGSVALILAVAILLVAPLPNILNWMVIVGIAAAAWWLSASLVASWWIYDVSPLTRWNWIVSYLPTDRGPPYMLNIHSGFDDTTLQIRQLQPQATIVAIDLYDPQRMTEPSIHRARRSMPLLDGTFAATPDSLPVADGAADAVLLLLAAHELRNPSEREALFGELQRTLREGGRVILAEHVRDTPNFVAFGPGFMHFLPFDEWLRLRDRAGFRVVDDGRFTPFVRYLVLEK